mgnify:CR=1 FL=1
MKRVLECINFLSMFSVLAVVTGYQTTAWIIKPMLIHEDIPAILQLFYQIINTYNPFNSMSMTVFMLVVMFSGITYLATKVLLKQLVREVKV